MVGHCDVKERKCVVQQRAGIVSRGVAPEEFSLKK